MTETGALATVYLVTNSVNGNRYVGVTRYAACRNREWTADSRTKLSAACKKKYENPTARLKTGLSQRGKYVSDATRRNQSLAAKRRAQTEEGRENSRKAGLIGSAIRWGTTRTTQLSQKTLIGG
jgi:predicted GIY-YIG superfamily endonuclease